MGRQFSFTHLGYFELGVTRVRSAPVCFSLQRAVGVRQEIRVCHALVTPRESGRDRSSLFKSVNQRAGGDRLLTIGLDHNRVIASGVITVYRTGSRLLLLRMASLPFASFESKTPLLQVSQKISSTAPPSDSRNAFRRHLAVVRHSLWNLPTSVATKRHKKQEMRFVFFVPLRGLNSVKLSQFRPVSRRYQQGVDHRT